jgi:plasmid replication initiation protein
MFFKGDNMDQWESHQELIKKLDREKMENSPEAKESEELACRSLELTKYRNERNLMLFPFCSTSKRKRLKTIEYRSADGKRWLQVSASHNFGMVKIWDFDILRFALSKAGEAKKLTNYFPSFIEFSVYECLKSIKRDPENGKNFIWFKEALRRLASTTYIGNIFRDDTKRETGFTLIKYEYIEATVRGGFDKVKITFDERLVESARYQNGLLAIDTDVIKEESGIKKRLLELVKVSKENAKEWTVGLTRLQQMCAHEGELKKFKSQLKGYDLPWKIEFSKAISGEENIKFFD